MPSLAWRLARLSSLVAAVVLLAACPRTPVVQLWGARVAYPSPQGIAMDMFLRVNNDNPYDVEVRNVDVHVTIADRYRLPPTRYSPQQWLRAGHSTIVRVPVVVPWALVTPLLSTSVGSPSIKYRAVGVADVSAVRAIGFQKNNYPVDEEGAVSRLELLVAAGRGAGM